MAAADKLGEFLNSLDDDALKAFCRKVNYTEPALVITPTTSRTTRVLLDSNLRHHLPGFNFATYRRKIVRRILSAETDDPGFFNRVCREAEIETDGTRTLDYQRISAEASADAAQSASVSADAAAASEKHASTANRIAEKSNRMSLASIIVSGITALIAVGSLIVAIIALTK